MGRMYSVSFSKVAVTALQDFFEVVAPATAVVILHSVVVSQSSDAKDAEDEQLPIAIRSGATTSGSGGSAPTAIPMSLGDAVFGGTVEVNNTTESQDGSIVTHHAESFNIRAGFAYIPTPEARIVLSPSARLAVVLLTAPTDSLTMDGTLVFEEIGT